MKIETVSIDAVHTDKKNARKHNKKNLDAIRGSIKDFGTVEPIIVQKSTGKIIGGNGRYSVLKELGRKTVDVVYVDLDDTRATALGLALNRTAELAEWDDTFLDEALKSLQSLDFDLSGIGFDDMFVHGHFREKAEPKDANEEWKGMPEFNQDDKTSFRQMLVHFKTQDDVDAFAKLIDQTITDKTKSVWYPKVEKQVHVDKRYSAE